MIKTFIQSGEWTNTSQIMERPKSTATISTTINSVLMRKSDVNLSMKILKSVDMIKIVISNCVNSNIQQEKIKCSFILNLTNYNADLFEGTLQILSQRPIFGKSDSGTFLPFAKQASTHNVLTI